MGEVEYEWDEAKRNWNLKERDLDFADAHLIYKSEPKVTLPSSRNHEDRWQDIDIVELMGLTLVLVYTKRKSKVRSFPCAKLQGRSANYMPMSGVNSKTNWDRVKHNIDSDAPIIFNPEDELYDPNDDEAVEAFWSTATITVTRRGPHDVTKKVVSLHLSPDVIEHYQAQGGDWQAHMDEVLRKGME